MWSAVKPENDYRGKRVTLKIEGMRTKDVDAVDTLHALAQNIEAREVHRVLLPRSWPWRLKTEFGRGV